MCTTAEISHFLPEWCREGGSGHHGQRASSGREICVWDFPTHTAVHQVTALLCLLPPLTLWYTSSWWSRTNCPWFCRYSSDTLLSHVEQLLRAFILKISVCDAVLNNNPPGNVTDDKHALPSDFHFHIQKTFMWISVIMIFSDSWFNLASIKY